MEKIVEQAYLYDFYGELLTEHQKRIYEEIVYQDLSISEIAKQEGITRQGVHDLVRRCDRILQDYEEKLHLVERFLKDRREVEQIRALADSAELSEGELRERMLRIAEISATMLAEMFE